MPRLEKLPLTSLPRQLSMDVQVTLDALIGDLRHLDDSAFAEALTDRFAHPKNVARLF